MQMRRPCKNAAYSGKITTSEGCAFALVTQIYPFQMLVYLRGSMYFHCALGMFEKSSQTDAKSMKNRRKIDGKSSKIDPRNSKLALRSALAGPGKLSEPPRWSPNAPRCSQHSPTCVQVGPTRPNKAQLEPQVGFSRPWAPPGGGGREGSRGCFPWGFEHPTPTKYCV